MAESGLGYRNERNLLAKTLPRIGILLLISSMLPFPIHSIVLWIMLISGLVLIITGVIINQIAPKYRKVCDTSSGQRKYWLEFKKGEKWVTVPSKNKWW